VGGGSGVDGVGSLPVGRVTVLFTDVEGSTHLIRTLGDRYDEVLSDHFRLLRAAVEDRGGTVVRTEGDSLFAVFEDAAAAVEAAAAGQRALGSHPWPDDGQIRVRMGLRTGEVRRQEGDYVGLTIHLAARLVAAANGGQVVVSATTASAAEAALPSTVRLRHAGRWRIRDVDPEEGLFLVEADGVATPRTALRATPADVRNLPPVRTSFVGREDELRDVGKLFEKSRLVTVTGPGGTGKTRLGVEVVRSLAAGLEHGGAVALLAGARDAADVLRVVAESIGVQSTSGGDVSEAHLVDALADRRLLLVLDNCEQVAEAVAGLCDALLDAAPSLLVLTTSRRPLEVAGETVYPLGALDVPAEGLSAEATVGSSAVRLFLERAQAHDPGLRADADALAAIGAICRRVDGLPLAIELAAARARSLPLGELAERVGRHVSALGTGARGGEERQRTITSLIDWSLDLLDDRERLAFARCSVFRGGFRLAAAEAVVGREPVEAAEVDGLLDALVRDSLLRLDGDGRYRMLSLVRQVAADRLRDSGDHTEAARAQLRHLAHWAETTAEGFQGPGSLVAGAAVDEEMPNLRAALAVGLDGDAGEEEARLATSILLGIHGHWERRGLRRELEQWTDAALVRLPEAERLRARLLRGQLATTGGELPLAREHLLAAAAGAAECSDERVEALALLSLGHVHWLEAELDEADDVLLRTEALAERLDDVGLIGSALDQRGNVARLRSDFDAAAGLHRRALGLLRSCGDLVGEAVCLGNLGSVEQLRGHVEAGHELHLEALAVALRLGDVVREANVENVLAVDEWREGNLPGAVVHYRRVLEIAEQIGDQELRGIALGNLGMVSWAQGDHLAAEQAYAEAMRVARRSGNRRMELSFAGNWAMAAWAADDLPTAAERLEVARTMAVEIAAEPMAVEATLLLAQLAVLDGRNDDAAKLALAALGTPVADRAHAVLAVVAARRGDQTERDEHAEQALQHLRPDAWGRPYALVLLALAVPPEGVAVCLGALAAWSTATGSRLVGPDRAHLDAATATARAALGADRYEALVAEATGLAGPALADRLRAALA
jgi:predicted ATPase/class 3 adenylate cyclase